MVVALVLLILACVTLAVAAMATWWHSRSLQAASAGRLAATTLELTAARQRVADETARSAELVAARRQAEADLHAQRSRLATATDDAAAAVAERDSLRAEVHDLRAQLAALDESLREAKLGGGHGETMWQLELARSDRTWQLYVAAAEDAPSPFAGADDALLVALNVEAAALREQAGTTVDVHWQANRVRDPRRSLVVLRVVQEVLAQGAKIAETMAVGLEETPNPALTIRGFDEAGEALALPAPDAAAPLLERVDGALRLRLEVTSEAP